MFRKVDRSPTLARMLESMSTNLARRRGLPIVIGVLLIGVSFVVDLVNMAAPAAWLDLAWSITHHVGLLTALIGILLVEPLGR
jgi:hypothetical protein